MDGLDTYGKIIEIHPTQKAIIVSGFSETERVITAQALGAGAYLRKPYIIEKLGFAVRRELEKKIAGAMNCGTPTMSLPRATTVIPDLIGNPMCLRSADLQVCCVTI